MERNDAAYRFVKEANEKEARNKAIGDSETPGSLLFNGVSCAIFAAITYERPEAVFSRETLSVVVMGFALAFVVKAGLLWKRMRDD